MSAKQLEICEVGPRDGLQSAAQILSVAARVAFVEQLVAAGLTKVEVGSLVNPKLVPTMADSDKVYSALQPTAAAASAEFSLLVPNPRGLEQAIAIGCKSIAFFTATSETFNQKNINRSVAESLADLTPMINRARTAGMTTRLYISTVFDCAYEGTMDAVNDLKRFVPLFTQVDEISLGDTTGRATKKQVSDLVASGLLANFHDKIWWHFHDTYRLAAENATWCMQNGFRKFDSSAGGIGGCPFSPGAKGNIATEKVLQLADAVGLQHGVKLPLALPTPE
ncbi:hydroxymethylglutaryl-CoA lyase [Turneriella parva]|uniref:Pyruvate carboxyltransferase n=1 Tax=Turneriella parva (strain ATCC BAA-1111 / DSM 21527 / NCTC 11395 / H) TaxID=869212 RepID=I4B402_TURPD|nr:hydroxymethylglutaryl-CoA lyase [Turneriella parva]AFM12009.1 pyruvate carboxyltransferase [Turneriella parva DSM 21527]